jgi:uncharacterized protein (TIGR04222 family)
MNPFDLRGPDFLAFYVVVFWGVVAVATWLRWLLRQPSDEPRSASLELSSYEVAFLSGGEELTFNAAIIRLVDQGALAVDFQDRKLTASADGVRSDASELERAVYSAVEGETGTAIDAVRQVASFQMAPLRQRLQGRGLLMPDHREWAARVLPLVLMLLLTLFGVVKIFVGLSRGRPVGFLTALCVISVLVAWIGFGRRVHRSRRGDRALAQLKEENSALKIQADRRWDELKGEDQVLCMALFGLSVLAHSPWANLQTALAPPSGSSSGCGGGGGGCGGGGCGGCGCGGCGG